MVVLSSLAGELGVRALELHEGKSDETKPDSGTAIDFAGLASRVALAGTIKTRSPDYSWSPRLLFGEGQSNSSSSRAS